MSGFSIFLILLGLLAFVAITIYNSLVRKRNMVKEGWSGIDVQLKRRANLIPNLVETVKGYVKHEAGLLEDITRLRSLSGRDQSVSEQGRVESELGRTLGKLFAVAESYPDLKADGNFAGLQEELARIEDEIQMARRYYNGAVRNLNIAVESFPSNLVAAQFGFQQAEFFEIEDDRDREVPRVSF